MARPVKLYVYDLSQGMARQFSMPFLGIQLDAIYHTSVVVDHKEFYFGQGIQVSKPGKTHHGLPMEVIDMGATELPEEILVEYLEDIKDEFSAQKYDLFQHNCNNFSDTFVNFLVGKSIPSHIVSLPERVLQTPFGAMLRPQIDAAMRPVTQAPTLDEAFPQHGQGG